MRSAADLETALARLDDARLAALDVAATLAVEGTTASVRELPRISIDLHSTLPGKPSAAARAAATDRPERDLEVLGPIGEGGMGRVLLARQHSLDREVAIKTLHAAATEREREALISEGAITGHLEHPSIVPVHALGLDGEGRPVLVMKRVEGVEWTKVIDGGGEPLARHLEILIQVCHAVEFAHSRDVVHRDIKPQNVLIGRYGDVYLCDWGLAVRTDRAWDPQPLCGTPGFMAPEMVLGLPVDARTDVYLLGATLHYLLTGRPRNGGEDARTASLAALDGAPHEYPASVPPELAALANRATARDPADRPTVAALREALSAHLRHGSSLALARSAAERVATMAALDLSGEDAQRRFDALAIEARFALEQALSGWPDNPDAQAAARELDRLLAARRARAAELEKLARELDPRPLGPERAIALAVLAVVGVVLAAIGIAGYPDLPGPAHLFYQSLVPTGTVLLMTAVLRRRVLATAFNRRLVLVGVAAIGGVSLSRGLEVVAGTTTPAMLLHDSIFLGLVLAIASSFVFRWLAVPALLMLGAGVVAALSPAHAHVAFSIGSGATLIALAIFGGGKSRA